MNRWWIRLHQVRRKHRAELRGLLRGEIPGWLVPGAGGEPVEVPVFVFHDPEPAWFEACLRFLADNGYRSLTADALFDLNGRVPDGERLVAVSFDDALWSTHAVAFPLLREYGFRAILFVVPGVVRDEDGRWPDLVDVRAGRATHDDLVARARREPFCTWSELAEMCASGVFDVQSHSLSHSRIPVSPRVIDFVHPELDLWHGNFDLPISSLDVTSERIPRLGAPLFHSAPRLSGKPCFVENQELVRALIDRATTGGGESFFASRSWRSELQRELHRWPPGERGRFETSGETTAAMRREIAAAREMLESRLPAASVRHLAYPWHVGGDLADRLAAGAGKRSVFYGPSIPPGEGPGPLRIRRLPESYLPRLPGRGRATFSEFLRIRMGPSRSHWGSYS